MTVQDSNTPALSESMVRNKDTSQFVGFRLANQEYAFRIEQIQEIVILRHVTPTPQVPDFVEGVSNLRGTIIPVINLRRLFGMEGKAADDDARTIVVNVGDQIIGCAVDSVTQVIRVPKESIQPAPRMITADQPGYITGLVKRDDGILVILDIDEFLAPDKLDHVKHAAVPINPQSAD